MKKVVLFVVSLLHITGSFGSCVTYQKSGGRFGDNLRAFSRALWVSYKYGIPLVYSPFEHSELLRLNILHEHEEDAYKRGLKQVIIEKSIFHYLTDEYKGHLLIVPWRSAIMVDWSNKGFIELLKTEIAPLIELPHMTLPLSKHHVALHVRIGSGQDSTLQIRGTYDDEKFPNKFPPYSFFVEQLQRLSRMLHDEPLYVYVFTDSLNPEKIVDFLKEHVGKSNIEYDCRKKVTQNSLDILADFFAMTQFSYFIRPKSFFSSMAEKLSHWKFSVCPKYSFWDQGKLVVSGVETITRSPVQSSWLSEDRL